jgi:alpha-amylase
VSTKWGPKTELLALRDHANGVGVGLYQDAVLNHKAGADHIEQCRAIVVDNNNRNKTEGEPFEIGGWLGFDFPGRGDKYSSQKYHWYHFTGTDYDDNTKKTAIYKILGDGKDWAQDVDHEVSTLSRDIAESLECQL